MALEHELETPLAKAVRAAGSQAAFAEAIAKPVTTVNSWLARGTKLAAELVPIVSRLYGIPRHELRPDLPDLFPREESPAHPSASRPLPADGSSSSLESVQA